MVRHPEARQLGDPRGIDYKTLREHGPFDLVMGGLPCDDFENDGALRTHRSGMHFQIFVEILKNCARQHKKVSTVVGRWLQDKARWNGVEDLVTEWLRWSWMMVHLVRWQWILVQTNICVSSSPGLILNSLSSWVPCSLGRISSLVTVYSCPIRRSSRRHSIGYSTTWIFRSVIVIESPPTWTVTPSSSTPFTFPPCVNRTTFGQTFPI